MTHARKTGNAITAKQVGDFIEEVAPPQSGNPGDHIGFVYGDPHIEVTGVAVMWNADSRSIQKAIDRGCNLLLVHEQIDSLIDETSDWIPLPAGVADAPGSIKRRKLLDDHNITVFRSHSNWDALPDDGVPDQAVKALGIQGLEVVAREKYFRVHRLPSPMTLRELAAHAQRGLDLPFPCRIYGDENQRVENFTFMIGGFGCNQFNIPVAARHHGAQCVIIGEMMEWLVLECLELGIPVVHTQHSNSEQPAIRRQAQMVAEAFPTLPVHYITSGLTGWMK